ncbi:Tn3 family transposase [Nocardia sp. CY41]|uniref:Tn3 family transposase n=1 Tax=Nocardia sp. CY41 TaxID=2608686 RepID=UPI002E2E370A|nr:Tn3 family transposase [Nocardia sp. CY41]
MLSGTLRDSLHAVDVVLRQQGGTVPEKIITDTGSYSDIMFGLPHLLGRQYRPQLANLPDQRSDESSNPMHVLRLADDEPYRREIKAQAILTEGRHDPARRICHGRRGQMTRTYYEGMEKTNCQRWGWSSTAWCWGTPSIWIASWPSCAPSSTWSLTRT